MNPVVTFIVFVWLQEKLKIFSHVYWDLNLIFSELFFHIHCPFSYLLENFGVIYILIFYQSSALKMFLNILFFFVYDIFYHTNVTLIFIYPNMPLSFKKIVPKFCHLVNNFFSVPCYSLLQPWSLVWIYRYITPEFSFNKLMLYYNFKPLI